MDLIDRQLVESVIDPALKPTRVLVDMAVDEQRTVMLTDGSELVIQVKGIEDRRDSVHGALTDSRVRLQIGDDQEFWLTCGTYHLPKTVGNVRIDCLATSSYVTDTERNAWAIEKHVLLRIWPKDGPLLPGGCHYPIKGDWFHSQSQAAAESIFVNAWLSTQRIQYQPHIDLGGCQGEEVVAPCAGVVLTAGMVGHDQLGTLAYELRPDVVMLIDGRGWIHKFGHLQKVADGLLPGQHVQAGHPIGELGKAGPTGGWSHLHYEARSSRPSGEWGHEDMYAYLLETWAEEHDAAVIACGRPHRKVKVGEPVVLSGRNTWASEGADLDFWWVLPDRRPVRGRDILWTPTKAGTYSAIMRVEDGRGNSDADPCIIQVHEPGVETLTIHAALSPSHIVKVGDPVTVHVRSFNNPEANGETIDWGDARDNVIVHSDGNVNPDEDGYARASHSYDLPGNYRIRIRCSRADGQEAEVTLLARVR